MCLFLRGLGRWRRRRRSSGAQRRFAGEVQIRTLAAHAAVTDRDCSLRHLHVKTSRQWDWGTWARYCRLGGGENGAQRFESCGALAHAGPASHYRAITLLAVIPMETAVERPERSPIASKLARSVQNASKPEARILVGNARLAGQHDARAVRQPYNGIHAQRPRARYVCVDRADTRRAACRSGGRNTKQSKVERMTICANRSVELLPSRLDLSTAAKHSKIEEEYETPCLCSSLNPWVEKF